MYTYLHWCMYLHGSQQLALDIFLNRYFYLLRKNLLLNPKLITLISLASQFAPEIFCPTLECWDYRQQICVPRFLWILQILTQSFYAPCHFFSPITFLSFKVKFLRLVQKSFIHKLSSAYFLLENMFKLFHKL